MADPNSFGPPTVQSQPPGHDSGGFRFEELPFGEIEVPDVTKGMVNRLPRDQVDPGTGRLVLNGRFRDDWVGRRPGTEIVTAKPDSDPVLAVVTFISEAGTVFICRVTHSSFHVLSASQEGWVEFDILDSDGDPATFSGISRRLDFSQFFGRMYMTDGALNRLWVIDFTANTVKEVADAPRGHFTTMFAERIIVANLRERIGGIRPSKIRWCANADPFDWDSISAGEEDLAAANVGDEITGIFGFEREMVILRRRSIWECTRQPFAAAPFRFLPVLDGMGCDLPYTAVKVPSGIIYADQRTRDVYFYRPGSPPEPLGAAINRDLYEDIGRLEFAQGAFDPYEKEYHLGLVISHDGTTITRTWVFSLEKQAWALDDSPEVTALGVVSLPGTSPTIDELVPPDWPTTIDDQFPAPTGTIDDYRQPGGVRPTLFKGTEAGEVVSQTYDSDHDWDGTEFEFVFRSPNLGSVSKRRSLKDLELEISGGEGDYSLAHLLEEETATYRNTKTGTTPGGKGKLRLPKKGVTGDDIFWELVTSAPGFRLHSWWARLLEKGRKR